jgi:DHA2 family multidrug resistance protein-like MFS transporter
MPAAILVSPPLQENPTPMQRPSNARKSADEIGEDGLPVRQRHIAMAAILAAITLVVLDGAIANVALPTIASTLRVSPAASVWVVTGYQIAVVMALLPCAALGESQGYRRIFTAGVLVFTAASALCALSPTLPWLVAARFLQGLGGAAVMSLGVALLRFIYPRRLVGTAMGWNALVVALSSAIGPTVGAAILSVGSWHWLFAVNIPIGAVVMFASRALPHSAGTARRIDLFSVALNAGAFASLFIGIDLLAARPWLGAVLVVAAALCFATLIRRELPRAAPLIPLDLLREGSFRVSVIASICCFASQMASYVALPFYLQHGLGQSTVMTGLYMTPWPLAVAFAAPLAGRLSNHVPAARLCAAGALCLAVGLALAALWPLHGSPAPLVAFTMICGLGFGFFQTPNNRNMLLSAPRARSGAAGGMQGTARLAGQTAGGVVMTLLFTVASTAAAPRYGLAVGAALALTAAFVSTRHTREVGQALPKSEPPPQNAPKSDAA